MDYFCKECAAARPDWGYDEAKSFRHACQRCFQMKACNDYADKTGRNKPAASPHPKEMIRDQINPQAEAKLPTVKGHREVQVERQTATPGEKPVNETEADKALNAIQPNRPGVKLEKIDKSQSRV